MRKAQKQEVLEMIQTLHQAHDEIKNYMDKKNYALAQDILSQCQECAISIGTAIEKLEGEGFITVSYVETYCDVLFSIYEELNGSDVNANKTHKNLKKQLLRIENSVKNDVPVRKEVAFFPYKASMWDALESVYLAAKEDPDCDAYCVPIPYYDRNPDRSLGEKHYEGREYPKNIEVIDWQTYNFEERKPDVIYIHNPYDDWNLVTCVHPRFFSANLKKYTEELVYIPYFVLDEIEPTDQARIEGMKHFCFLPGVVNADKVIVQSEKMKQIYVNEYLKAAQANGLGGYHLDRKKLEEKFLGLGSPKFDKVKNTKKEDLEIPDEWLRIIEKPDGSWKKIIFYNTSIAALLENNEKMLEKMKYVFSVFKENQDEVALLWRPHPLIKSTVSSMRPQLWAEYEKLVNQYRQEGWGIYDDSSDMDRAVVLSDAYYGDMSSVVQVYQRTGKPVMLQQCEESILASSVNLKIGAGVLYQDKVYFSEFSINGLFCMDIHSGEIIYLKKFENETQHFMLYRDAYVYENEAWFLPWKSRYIVRVNLDTLEMEYYEVPFRSVNPNVKDAAYSVTQLIQNRYICMIPKKFDAVLLVDLKEKKIIPYYDVVDTSREVYDFGCVAEEEILMFSKNNLQAIRLNLKTGTKKYVSCPEIKDYADVECAKSALWFVSNENHKIVKMDMNMTRKEYISMPEEMKGNIPYRSLFFNHKIWLLPLKEERLYSVDSDNHQFSVWGEEEGVEMNLQYGMRKISCQDKLMIAGKGHLIIWNSVEKLFKDYYLMIDRQQLLEHLYEGVETDKEKMSLFCNGKNTVREEYLTLGEFLNIIGAFNKS